MHSWFLHNSLGTAGESFDLAVGREVEVWRTTLLVFLFSFLHKFKMSDDF